MQTENTTQNRPKLLAFLCILTFIGSGASAFSNLFMYFYFDQIPALIDLNIISDLQKEYLDVVLGINKKYYLYSGLLNIISFVGARLIWNLRKTGLHTYAISQILILIVSTIYVYNPNGTFPTFDLLFAATFILLYFRFQNIMNTSNDEKTKN